MGATPFTRKEDTQRRWFLVDADGKTLGRLATVLAHRLMGKDEPSYTPHVDGGDFIVVVNAEKVRLTGKKAREKLYQWHTGHPGGLRQRSAEEMRERQPQKIVEWAVQGMLPKNRLGRKMIRKLKVYAGPEHPHEAQKPEPLEV
jgi:large subunit ribosomal protein L13